ncbi:hypothetical protein [Nocardia abscessus]|uniref:hypothetical protein n=1 Tax=Nocardia abscessus TaxID=120957 RepID=UPI002458476D|nr:hypothetical protein [Nocardia abscessus]
MLPALYPTLLPLYRILPPPRPTPPLLCRMLLPLCRMLLPLCGTLLPLCRTLPSVHRTLPPPVHRTRRRVKLRRLRTRRCPDSGCA